MIYLLIAYLIMPRLDHWSARRHPVLVPGDHLTRTSSGIPGDPLNIAVVGSEEDVVRALQAAGWNPANPLGFNSSVRIVVDTGRVRRHQRRGGLSPFREVARHGPIPLGGAVLTGAGRLPFKGIIHVAGITSHWRRHPR